MERSQSPKTRAKAQQNLDKEFMVLKRDKSSTWPWKKQNSHKALIPREEVKAQHNRVQKIDAPLKLRTLILYECKTPPYFCNPICLSLVGNSDARLTICAISPHCW